MSAPHVWTGTNVDIYSTYVIRYYLYCCTIFCCYYYYSSVLIGVELRKNNCCVLSLRRGFLLVCKVHRWVVFICARYNERWYREEKPCIFFNQKLILLTFSRTQTKYCDIFTRKFPYQIRFSARERHRSSYFNAKLQRSRCKTTTTKKFMRIRSRIKGILFHDSVCERCSASSS